MVSYNSGRSRYDRRPSAGSITGRGRWCRAPGRTPCPVTPSISEPPGIRLITARRHGAGGLAALRASSPGIGSSWCAPGCVPRTRGGTRRSTACHWCGVRPVRRRWSAMSQECSSPGMSSWCREVTPPPWWRRQSVRGQTCPRRGEGSRWWWCRIDTPGLRPVRIHSRRSARCVRPPKTASRRRPCR